MTISNPLVSVVIPAYNAARTLHATVQSVLRQTVRELELFIIDDGSKDETLAVANAISEPRIRVLSQPNAGVSAARNTGLRAATGKYVAFLDADDLWLPYKLERQLAVLESGRGPSAVQSGVYFVNDRLEILQVRPCTDTGRSLEESLLFQNLPAFPTTLVANRQCMLEVGGFDNNLVILEDWDMALKMSRYCDLRSVCEPLALYRVHPGNRSRNVDIHIHPGLLILARLFADPALPESIRRMKKRAYGTFYRMLAGGYLNQRNFPASLHWASKALWSSPSTAGYMAKLPLRWLARRWERRTLSPGVNGASLLGETNMAAKLSTP